MIRDGHHSGQRFHFTESLSEPYTCPLVVLNMKDKLMNDLRTNEHVVQNLCQSDSTRCRDEGMRSRFVSLCVRWPFWNGGRGMMWYAPSWF